MESRKQLRALFSGQVQGVGFRYTARSLASHFDVGGYVRNLPDGRVEIVAEGLEEELNGFLTALESSHLSGFIRSKQVNWDRPEGKYESFEIAV